MRARDALQVTTAHPEHLVVRNTQAASELHSAAHLVCELDGRILAAARRYAGTEHQPAEHLDHQLRQR